MPKQNSNMQKVISKKMRPNPPNFSQNRSRADGRLSELLKQILASPQPTGPAPLRGGLSFSRSLEDWKMKLQSDSILHFAFGILLKQPEVTP